MIPVLVDDLIAFSVALSASCAASVLGGLLGGFVRTRSRPQLQVRPMLQGSATAAALLVVAGVVWIAGDDAVDNGLIRLWIVPAYGQGALGRLYSVLASLVVVLFIAGVAFSVACVSAYLTVVNCRPDRRLPDSQRIRWRLGPLMLLVLAVSIALGAWTAVRRKSVNFELARSAAKAKWAPYGWEPNITRYGQVYSLKRVPDRPALPVTADVMREVASLRQLRSLDLSGLSRPNECFRILREAAGLHILDLSGSDVTDESLRDVAKLDLGILYLNDTSITDAGLMQLAPLAAALSPADEKGRDVSLHVHNTGVTPAGIAKLKALGEAAGGKWFINTEPRSSRRRSSNKSAILTPDLPRAKRSRPFDNRPKSRKSRSVSVGRL